MRTGRVVSIMMAGAAMVGLQGGCTDVTENADSTLVGSEVALGQGTARVEAVVSSTGAVKTLAVVLTESALNGLPQPPGPQPPVPEIVLPMPAGLQTVFDHAVLNWQPFGHPPVGTYDRPHFDAHFYLIPMAERDAMTPADPAFVAKATAVPPGAVVPPGYVGDGVAIPRMGSHWSDASAPEHHGMGFTRTLIFGYYDQRLAFIEPMMTVAYLQSNPDNEAAIPQPARYDRPGSYPTRWAVRHDATARTYRVELRDFVAR